MLLLASILLAASQTQDLPQDLEARAQAAYRDWDLESAESYWLARLDGEGGALNDRERGRVLYNLGNTAFRRDDELRAIGYYTAALRYRPRDTDTWTNLEFARSEAGLAPADRGDLAATVKRLVSSLTLAESEWLVLACLLVFGCALAGEAFRGGRFWYRLSLALGCVVLLSMIPWGWNLAQQGRDPVLVVAEKGARVRSEPRPDATVVAELVPGTEREREDELPQWVKIGEGWVRADDVFGLR